MDQSCTRALIKELMAQLDRDTASLEHIFLTHMLLVDKGAVILAKARIGLVDHDNPISVY